MGIPATGAPSEAGAKPGEMKVIGAVIDPDNPSHALKHQLRSAMPPSDQNVEIQAEVYALEMAIHVKRAERERKRQELEAEFASVFQVNCGSGWWWRKTPCVQVLP